jgi:hypothetical protein
MVHLLLHPISLNYRISILVLLHTTLSWAEQSKPCVEEDFLLLFLLKISLFLSFFLLGLKQSIHTFIQCPSCSLSTKNDATIKIEDVGASICWGKPFLTETRLTITETYFLKECLKFSHPALLQLHLKVNRCCMSLVEISEIWRWTLKVAETVRKRSEFRQSKSWCPKIARSLELLLVPDAWKAHTCRLSLSET